MKKKKGFTLIELIVVLVIIAIVALIVTPLLMSIIKKAKVSADKRSIDAYGRSIELSITGYLMDNGAFPTSIEDLTIEYSGSEVVCSTTQLNPDSTVYLEGCTVNGRSVDGYTYGTDKSPTYDAYSVGDHLSYNGVTYYVIEDSGIRNDTVKLMKEVPITYTEMVALNVPGVSVYSDNSYGTLEYGNGIDYSTSNVKKIVDAWQDTAVASGDTATARLITLDELINNLGYDHATASVTEYSLNNETTPSWVYNGVYWYWTMTPDQDYSFVWTVVGNGDLLGHEPTIYRVVRPVLELNKSANISVLN